MTRLARPHPRAALGLLEVLIAALVLGVAVVSVFQAISTGVKGTERVEEELIGTNLAQDLLEFLGDLPLGGFPDVRTKPLVDLPLTGLAGAFAGSRDDSVRRSLARKVSDFVVPPGYEVLVGIEPAAGASNRGGARPAEAANLVMLTVRVRWTASLAPGGEVRRQLVLATLVTDDQELDL